MLSFSVGTILVRELYSLSFHFEKGEKRNPIEKQIKSKKVELIRVLRFEKAMRGKKESHIGRK